jgi:hypothetical protein
MNRLAWMGVAVAVALIVATLVLYFMFSDRSYHGKTLPQIPAPNAGQTPQISQPPSDQKVGTVVTSFDASAYEVNYTLVSIISLSGITITTEGWFVVGVGPSGNYSFGAFTSSLLRSTTTYKSATEGGTTYIMTCHHGHCTVDRKKWPFTGLIEGINATRTAVGQCRHLGYAGTLYEERGMFKPKTSPHRVEDVAGNYTAYICEVNGVMLFANLTATPSAYSDAVYVVMKIEAVKTGPYRPDVHRLILKEIKANR